MIKRNMIVTREYLRNNPDDVFVFGDNLLRTGYGGAAVLRDCHNTLPFITKKFPNNNDCSFYRPDEYVEVFEVELAILISNIITTPDRTFLISRLGNGLANKYGIWEKIIKERLETDLKPYNNVILLWEE